MGGAVPGVGLRPARGREGAPQHPHQLCLRARRVRHSAELREWGASSALFSVLPRRTCYSVFPATYFISLLCFPLTRTPLAPLRQLNWIDAQGRYFVQVLDSFVFQGHLCIVTELMGRELWASSPSAPFLPFCSPAAAHSVICSSPLPPLHKGTTSSPRTSTRAA